MPLGSLRSLGALDSMIGEWSEVLKSTGDHE